MSWKKIGAGICALVAIGAAVVLPVTLARMIIGFSDWKFAVRYFGAIFLEGMVLLLATHMITVLRR